MLKHPTDLKQVSGLLKQVLTTARVESVADYGAGTGTKSAELAAERGIKLYRYDPHLPAETNQEFWEAVDKGVDVVTCANVLNVLTDDKELDQAIRRLASISSKAKLGAVVSIYQAPEPSKTQRAKPISWYADRIRELTEARVDVEHGKIWIYKQEKTP